MNAGLAHIPAKWIPVRRQGYAQTKDSRAWSDSEGTDRALLPEIALDRRPDEADDAGRDHADGGDEALGLDPLGRLAPLARMLDVLGPDSGSIASAPTSRRVASAISRTSGSFPARVALPSEERHKCSERLDEWTLLRRSEATVTYWWGRIRIGRGSSQ